MNDAPKIVEFPKAEVTLEERAHRLRAEVNRLASLPVVEWLFYLEGTAEKHGVSRADLKVMVEAVIREREKKAREDKGELRHAERQKSTTRRESERKQERKQERKEREEERKAREAKKEAERKDKEKQKAFAAIVKLPRIEHEGKLKALAKQLGEDVEVLQEEFAELRTEEEEKIKRGEVEPWDEPVNTRKLLDEVTAQFGKYIIVHDQIVAPIVPLWICFAWVHDIATFSPLLIFESANSGEAKTLASRMVALQAPRMCMIVEPTGAAFYRLIDRVHPTLVIDDADRLLPRRPDLSHIVNGGWMRGVPIPRVDARTGDVHLFDSFCPKVLNGIDLLAHLAPATRTRCITIKLLPKLEGEKVADHRHADRDENFAVLRRKLLRWSTDNMAALDSANPKMPEGFFNRLEENYHLMFAIADLAGGAWPEQARAAAVKLSHEHNTPSLGKLLLTILFELSVRHRTTLLTSKQLEQLVPAEDDAFASYQNNRPINKYEIAQLLKPYGPKPTVIHPRGRTADRGYDTTSPEFTRAFRHYLGKALPRGRTIVRKRPPRKK